MKLSQLRNLIKEEVNTVLKEQETSNVMKSINHIKDSVKELSDSDIAQNDLVLQKLLAKFTGLLGKITSYTKTKYKIEDEPEEVPTNADAEDTETGDDDLHKRLASRSQQRPKPPVKPEPKQQQGPSTPISGAPNYNKTT